MYFLFDYCVYFEQDQQILSQRNSQDMVKCDLECDLKPNLKREREFDTPHKKFKIPKLNNISAQMQIVMKNSKETDSQFSVEGLTAADQLQMTEIKLRFLRNIVKIAKDARYSQFHCKSGDLFRRSFRNKISTTVRFW